MPVRSRRFLMSVAQDAEVRALMQQMNAGDGVNKVQLTLYTSRWRAAPRPPLLSRHRKNRARPPPAIRPANAPAPAARTAPPRCRRYTRQHELELAEMSRPACCALS